jgi:hypothetical protein
MRLSRILLTLLLNLVDISVCTLHWSESAGEEVPLRHDTRVDGKVEIRDTEEGSVRRLGFGPSTLQFQELHGTL